MGKVIAPALRSIQLMCEPDVRAQCALQQFAVATICRTGGHSL